MNGDEQEKQPRSRAVHSIGKPPVFKVKGNLPSQLLNSNKCGC